MSIVKMKKLELIGLKKDRNRILDVLTYCKMFEVSQSVNLTGAEQIIDKSAIEDILSKQAKVSFAINFLEQKQNELESEAKIELKEFKKKGVEPKVKYAKPKMPLSFGRRIITFDDFNEAGASEYELLAVGAELDGISDRMIDNKAQLAKAHSAIKSLLPFENLTLQAQDIKDYRNFFVTVYYKNSENAQSVENKLCEIDCAEVECDKCNGYFVATAIGLNVDKDKIDKFFVDNGYAKAKFAITGKISDNLAELREEITRLNENELALSFETVNYEKYLLDFKALYDFLELQLEKAEAEKDFFKTRSTFVVTGWLPADSADMIVEEIRSKTNKVVTYLNDPTADDEPPSLVKNSYLVAPYQEVTNMYATPSYNEIDPNPFVAVFFFLFFGIMLSDAGYGLLLALASIIALKVFKFETSTSRLLLIIAMGSISTIIWGLLFGGVFGIPGIPALWFNPIEEPIMMLGLSVGLGILQILVGLGIKAVSLIREKKVWSAIFDVGSIYLLFLGLGVLVLGATVFGSTVTMVGMILFFSSLGIIVLTAGREKKGILGKIMGGFAGLYGLVNLLSDVLSYARLFGLGLATGAIAMAFNILGEMLFSIPIIGYPLGFIVLIPLHAINLGISVLGAYVHNARLQFLEFFNKFYEGEGRIFSPMGMRTKYIRIERKIEPKVKLNKKKKVKVVSKS